MMSMRFIVFGLTAIAVTGLVMTNDIPQRESVSFEAEGGTKVASSTNSFMIPIIATNHTSASIRLIGYERC